MFFYELSHLDLYLFSFFMVMLITFVIWNITFVLGDTNSIYYHTLEDLIYSELAPTPT